MWTKPIAFLGLFHWRCHFLHKHKPRIRKLYSNNRAGVWVCYPLPAGNTHSIRGGGSQQYLCDFTKKFSFLDFSFLPWLQVFPVYPGWHLHLFGPTHSPCLHPGWHIAANRRTLVTLPLQSRLTVHYFKTNGNDLTKIVPFMFLPWASLCVSNTTVQTTDALSKKIATPIHVGRTRSSLVFYFCTAGGCALSGILNSFSTSSARRQRAFTCAACLCAVIHVATFGKPGICPGYTGMCASMSKLTCKPSHGSVTSSNSTAPNIRR